MMNYATKCFMILLCLTLLAACSGKDTPTDLTGTLKIVYADESYFHSEYGQFFHAKFPNVDFEVISTDEKNQFLAANGFDNGKFLEVYQPDLVRIDNLQQYAELGGGGRSRRPRGPDQSRRVLHRVHRRQRDGAFA